MKYLQEIQEKKKKTEKKKTLIIIITIIRQVNKKCILVVVFIQGKQTDQNHLLYFSRFVVVSIVVTIIKVNSSFCAFIH
jgi:hypothetical protein